MGDQINPSEGELEVLRVLWADGPCGVQKVRTALKKINRPLALSTVSTVMKRMEDKGLIKAQDDRRPKIYVHVVEQKQTANKLVSDVLKTVFGGSPTRAILHLLGAKKYTEAELKALRKTIDEMK